jgi:hypothetical protein
MRRVLQSFPIRIYPKLIRIRSSASTTQLSTSEGFPRFRSHTFRGNKPLCGFHFARKRSFVQKLGSDESVPAAVGIGNAYRRKS